MCFGERLLICAPGDGKVFCGPPSFLLRRQSTVTDGACVRSYVDRALCTRFAYICDHSQGDLEND